MIIKESTFQVMSNYLKIYKRNLKKINIYVGVVGQAYVDKETAKSNLDRAKQNINDWNNIITLAQSVLDNTNPVSSRLIDAQSKATAVKTLLQTEMNNAINDTEKYAALSKLFNDLNALDYDNDFSNGGNTYTLDQINNALNSIIQEINDILLSKGLNELYLAIIESKKKPLSVCLLQVNSINVLPFFKYESI